MPADNSVDELDSFMYQTVSICIYICIFCLYITVSRLKVNSCLSGWFLVFNSVQVFVSLSFSARCVMHSSVSLEHFIYLFFAGRAPNNCQLCRMHGIAIIQKADTRIHKASSLLEDAIGKSICLNLGNASQELGLYVMSSEAWCYP